MVDRDFMHGPSGCLAGPTAQGPVAGGNWPEETVEILGSDPYEPLAEAGRGQAARRNPASQRVDADSVEGRGLLQRQPLR